MSCLTPAHARKTYLSHLESELHPKPQRKVYGKRGLRAMLRAAPHYPVGRLDVSDEDDESVLVCSDLHLGHANIIGYCDRPHADVHEMDEALWQGLLDAAHEDHTLVVVGDLAMGHAIGAPSGCRLAAQPWAARHLVLGNHDLSGDGTLRAEGFEHVWSALLSEGSPPLIWTHYPLAQVPDGYVNVHGHVHDQAPRRSPHINVSVEQLAYRPVPLSDVRLLAQALSVGYYPPGMTTLARIRALKNSHDNQAVLEPPDPPLRPPFGP